MGLNVEQTVIEDLWNTIHEQYKQDKQTGDNENTNASRRRKMEPDQNVEAKKSKTSVDSPSDTGNLNTVVKNGSGMTQQKKTNVKNNLKRGKENEKRLKRNVKNEVEGTRVSKKVLKISNRKKGVKGIGN